MMRRSKAELVINLGSFEWHASLIRPVGSKYVRRNADWNKKRAQWRAETPWLTVVGYVNPRHQLLMFFLSAGPRLLFIGRRCPRCNWIALIKRRHRHIVSNSHSHIIFTHTTTTRTSTYCRISRKVTVQTTGCKTPAPSLITHQLKNTLHSPLFYDEAWIWYGTIQIQLDMYRGKRKKHKTPYTDAYNIIPHQSPCTPNNCEQRWSTTSKHAAASIRSTWERTSMKTKILSNMDIRKTVGFT